MTDAETELPKQAVERMWEALDSMLDSGLNVPETVYRALWDASCSLDWAIKRWPEMVSGVEVKKPYKTPNIRSLAITNLYEDVEKMRKKIASLKETNEAFGHEIERLKRVIARLNSALYLDNKTREIERRQRQVIRIQNSTIEDKNSEIRKLKENLAEACSKVAELEEENKELQDSLTVEQSKEKKTEPVGLPEAVFVGGDEWRVFHDAWGYITAQRREGALTVALVGTTWPMVLERLKHMYRMRGDVKG